ncbi:MAG: P63C domain-containing protein [Sphingopyxis sp.]
MPKDKDTIEPIDADFDAVAKAMVASGEPNNEEDGPGKGNREIADANLPAAKWRGIIDLGGNELDCYVLEDGTRVLSSGSTTKAIADVERGSLQDYVGQKALKPYINVEKILQETIRFRIPGTQWPGLGITTEHFELICRGYVQALYEGAPLTDRQREMAIRCAVLTAGLTRTGLDALVDEATGYQYERADDALQVKLRAFIAEELRDWEKTFPDELWEEFGRLTNWKGSLHSRPKWWGKMVIELIYDTLDPDVAAYLKANKPKQGEHWHRQLTENLGVRQLVSRCYEVIGMAKTCHDMRELRDKVAEHYGNQTVQFTLSLPRPKRN